MLIGFNTGHYEAIDLLSWIASNPKYLLAANFGVPESVFEQFPHHRVFIAPKEGAPKSPEGRDQFPKSEASSR